LASDQRDLAREKCVSGPEEGDSNCYDRDRFVNDGVVSEITSNPKTATVNITTIIPCPPDTPKEEQESDQKTAFRSRRFKVSLQAILRGNVAATL
jgi:hypothetical protein